MDTSKGASTNERLLAAARGDNEELLLMVFEEGGFDINTKDGLGRTPLHIAAENRSVDVLEHILSHDDCDVDPVDNWGNTPLHIAIEKNKEEPEARNYIVENLLDAGADTRIKNKEGDYAIDLAGGDRAVISLIEAAELERQKQQSIGASDIARDEEDVDSDDYASDD